VALNKRLPISGRKFPTRSIHFNWAPPRRGARARSEIFILNLMLRGYTPGWRGLALLPSHRLQPSGPLYVAACDCGPLRVHPSLARADYTHAIAVYFGSTSLARAHSTLRSPLLSASGHPAACNCSPLRVHPSLARAYYTHAIAVFFRDTPSLVRPHVTLGIPHDVNLQGSRAQMQL